MMNFLKKIFSSLNDNSDMNKYLILGIGNIGSEYDDTRHNVGFEIVDQLAQNLETNLSNSFRSKLILIFFFLNFSDIMLITNYCFLLKLILNQLEQIIVQSLLLNMVNTNGPH